MRYSFFGIMAASFVATATVIGVQAPAQVIAKHNSRAPVSFDAGAMEIQDRIGRVILTGGVTASQAGLTVRASRLTAAYTSGGGTDIHRLDAVGGVTIAKEDLHATSDAAIYDLDGNLITLVGNVQLSQGANHLSGGRLVIDLDADRTTLSGGGAPVPGAPDVKRSGGRVTGTFTVPQRK